MSRMAAADARGTELGRYLKARRAQVRPEDLGLPVGAGLRRTPGLRREELAALAGVSVDYYIRLERGRETNPSAAVVDALGRVLRLRGDAYERLHELVELASGRIGELPASSDHVVRDSVLRMLESVRPLPAYVVSRYNRVLAANPPGRRLLPGLWDWPSGAAQPDPLSLPAPGRPDALPIVGGDGRALGGASAGGRRSRSR